MASGWDEDALAHIDVPRKFGEAAEYWNHYDKLSDKHNSDLIELMGGNLDILLIFVSPQSLIFRPACSFCLKAGLFSAINTAFIVLSLPILVQSSEDQMVQLLTLIAGTRTNLTKDDLAPQPFQVTFVMAWVTVTGIC